MPTAAARELGVDARAIVAQAALETGWGTPLPADASGSSHNYFGIKVGGIKAGASWSGASVASDTTEFVAGEAGTERARFRAYGSLAENVADYVRVLRETRVTPRRSAPAPTCAPSPMPCSAAAMPRIRSTPTSWWQPSKRLRAAIRCRGRRSADVKGFKSADASPIHSERG